MLSGAPLPPPPQPCCLCPPCQLPRGRPSWLRAFLLLLLLLLPPVASGRELASAAGAGLVTPSSDYSPSVTHRDTCLSFHAPRLNVTATKILLLGRRHGRTQEAGKNSPARHAPCMGLCEVCKRSKGAPAAAQRVSVRGTETLLAPGMTATARLHGAGKTIQNLTQNLSVTETTQPPYPPSHHFGRCCSVSRILHGVLTLMTLLLGAAAQERRQPSPRRQVPTARHGAPGVTILP